MEDTIMNVVEEVVNNEENVVKNVVKNGNGVKEMVFGSLITIAGYAAVKGCKKLYALIKAKKEHTEPVPVEIAEDVEMEDE